MATSQKIGSFRPMTFLHNNRPIRPVAPRAPDRSAGFNGIRFSGDVKFSDFKRNLDAKSTLSFRELGRGAVRLQKSTGRSINVTV